MTTPTREEIIDAYRELDMLLAHYDDYNPERVPECRAIIEKALPPRPQPTMADVEWDDDKHFLAEAELKGYGPAIMLWEATPGYISVIREGRVWPARYVELTPTGKRYTLTEVETHAS